MNMETLLNEEIEQLLNEMSTLKRDSKEYAAMEENLTKLIDRKLEIEKLKASEIQAENQMREDRKTRLYKNLIDIGLGVAPLLVTIWGAKASFKFEETGTITTAIGRKFMDKLIKK